MLERKKYIDYIKALGILLVIIGHVNFANDTIKAWIYSFHMPLFFFASGLTVRKEKINLAYIHKKVTSLVVPYVIWGFIYSGYSLKKVLFIGYASRQSLEMAGSLTSLWFLPVLFLAFLLSQCLLEIGKLGLLLIISIYFVTISLVPEVPTGYPWGINVAVTAAMFIMLGYLCEQKLSGVTYKRIFGLSIFITGFYRMNPININDYVMMATNKIGNPLAFLVLAMSGCIGIYGIANLIDLRKTNRCLSFIGQNSLLIMVVHKPFIELFKIFFADTGYSWPIQLVVATLGTLVLSTLMVILIKKFAPFLGGK